MGEHLCACQRVQLSAQARHANPFESPACSAEGFEEESPASPAVPDPAEELAEGEVWEEVDLDEYVLSCMIQLPPPVLDQ